MNRLQSPEAGAQPRRDHRLRLSAVLAVGFACTIACTTAVAANDNGCQPVFDAMSKMFSTPTHIYMTETAEFHPGKTTAHEVIYAGGTIYNNMQGKWIRSSMTVQQMMDQERENRKQATYTCRSIGEEMVNGQPASKYASHSETEDVKSDSQIWISRRSGLPLRLELDSDVGGSLGKSHRSMRYEYSNVQPPAM
jgi:hypothetical protein